MRRVISRLFDTSIGSYARYRMKPYVTVGDAQPGHLLLVFQIAIPGLV